MKTVVISQPMYFPWVGFITQLSAADVLVWLDDVQFSKGSFTNRVQVLLPPKQVWMTIPLLAKTNRQIADLEAKDEDWRQSHRDLLCQSFRKTPHSSLALNCFDDAMNGASICDTIIKSSEVCARALAALPKEIVRSSQLGIQGSGWERVLRLVKHFGGNRYLTGHGARHYLAHEEFEQEGVGVDYMDYTVSPWQQGVGEFTPYVTALDLIAAAGPQAPEHLTPKWLDWRSFLAGESN